MSDLELRDLRLVVALADELHFGRAATRLHLGQPALSQQLRRLERRLGVQLFERSTHHVGLTSAGRAFVSRARPVLAGVAELAEEVRAHRPENHLRLGCSAPLYDLAQVLMAGLGERLDGVEVREETITTFTVARQRLREGSLDVYLGLLSEAPEIASTRLRSDRFGLWVGADHPLASRSSVTLVEVQDLPVLVDPADASPEYVWLVERMYAAGGARVERLPGGGASMLAATLAAASGGPPVVGPQISPMPSDLRWVPFSDGHAHASWELAWRADDDRELTRRAVDAVRGLAAEQGWQVLGNDGPVIT